MSPFFSGTARCISDNLIVFEKIKIKFVVEKKLVEMKNGKTSEYWKRVTCIMMVPAGYQNADIIVAVQLFMDTVKAVRHDMNSCNRDIDVVVSRKGYSRRFNCIYKPEFIQQLQNQVMENPYFSRSDWY